MANNSISGDIGKFVLGGTAGFALYLLVSGLGFGRRGREGSGPEGKGPGPGEATEEVPTPVEVEMPPKPMPEPLPPEPMPRPTRPTRPKDVKRLTFVMTSPLGTEPYNPMAFQLIEEGRKTYSLGGLIARVKEGGRSDVALKIRGDIRTGSADEALSFIKKAGIEVWEEGTSSVPAVSGNDRGQYRRRYR